MTHSLTNDDIEFVSKLTTKAGILALSMANNLVVKQKSGPHDLVTNADVAVSELILAELKQRFPDDIHVSEEDERSYLDLCNIKNRERRTWFIDPIDGTDSFISKDGRYSVMVGILVDQKPVFGWIYIPEKKTTYFGGPEYGVKKMEEGNAAVDCLSLKKNNLTSSPVRMILTNRDQKHFPWVKETSDIELVKGGSIGLKVVKVIEQEADMLAYFTGKIKHWDTVGPTAIALGCGLEVGSLDIDQLFFDKDLYYHESSIIIGKPGSVAWSRSKFWNKELHR